MTVSKNSFQFYAFLALLVFAPLPLGSILPWSQALLTFGIYALLAVSVLSPQSSGLSTQHSALSTQHSVLGPESSVLSTILLLWSLAVLFALFQLIPLPSVLIAKISPSIHDLYSWALPGYGRDGSRRTLSTGPGSTISSALLIGACGAAFFLAAHFCRDRARAMTLAFTVVLVALGEAVYGLAQVGGSLARPASGTYVNRNHFAALLAMALCLGVGLLLHRRQDSKGEPDGASPLDRLARTSPLVAICLTILAGIIFSFSRMGLTAPIAMLVVFGGLWMLGPVSRRVRIVGAGIGAVVLLLWAGAWPALEVVAERFQALEDNYRIAAWEGAYALFQSSPIIGIGLGSLLDNLPRFLPEPIPETFTHTHNEALEVLAEGGFVYAALVLIGFVLYFAQTIPSWLKRRDPVARGLGLGCLAAICAVLLQSLVEFPLRMPANALYLSVIMGLGWAVIHKAVLSAESLVLSPSASRLTPHALLLIPALLGMALSASMLVANLLDRVGSNYLEQARRVSGEERQALLTHAQGVLDRAVRIEPWQPVHEMRLGRAYEAVAGTLSPLSDEGQAAWKASAEVFSRAVQRHPANGRFQAALAWASLQAGDLATSRRAAKAALKLAPDFPDVRFTLARWYLLQWEVLSAEDRVLATGLIQRGARELPEIYVETAWQLGRDSNVIRQVLPGDQRVRRLLLRKLTDRGLFAERWAEQQDYPYLRVPIPEKGLHVLARGRLIGRQESPTKAVVAPPWTGMVAGWLSGGLKAKADLVLPPGEAVLYLSVLGEPAGGIWPTLSVTLGRHGLPIPPITGPGRRTYYLLISTPGGRLPLHAVVTNGTVLLEHGQFIERRVTLGPVRILTPH